MAVVTEVPTNYSVYPDLGTVAAGAASAFRPALNAYIGSVESKVQSVQAWGEQEARYWGYGCISGGTIAAGVGLNVTVGAFEAVVGNYVRDTATGTVGGLTSNATNYIFLHQDGTWAVNTTGAIPGTANGHGTAVIWGQAVTGTGTVISVSNLRPYYAAGTLPMHAVTGVPNAMQPWGLGVTTLTTNGTADQTLTAAEYCNPKFLITGTVTGTVNIIVGTAPTRAVWLVSNKGTAAVRIKTVSGSGVVIASMKNAFVQGIGTDIERVTADA